MLRKNESIRQEILKQVEAFLNGLTDVENVYYQDFELKICLYKTDGSQISFVKSSPSYRFN